MKTVKFFLILLIATGFVLSQPVDAQAQRRWSPQAKGTTIGGVVGGAAGAIINKRNRLVGGLIGGAVGGATGYAIGKGKDNRNKAAARLAAARAETAREREAVAAAEHERDVALAAKTPTHGFGVTRPAQVTTAHVAEVASSAYVLNAAFLTNSSYGDPVTPYASSKYRRKSW